MKYPHRLLSWKVPLLLASLVGLTLFILACGGDDATPEPTAAAAPPPAATIDVAAITSGLQRTIQEEVGKIQPPLSEAEIRGLIEGAIGASMPDSVSAAEIQSMVDSAVAAAAAEGVTEADVTAAIGAALVAAMAAAPEPLTASEIEQIVKASIPTPAPVAMMTATPTPAPTAAPTAMAPTAMAEKIPVSPRLLVAETAPTTQVATPHPMVQTTGKMNAFYDHLVGRHIKTNEEVPELATSWTVQPDGKTWNFKLRENVPFYKDAKPTDYIFSSKDVVLAFKNLTNVGTDQSRRPGTWFNRLGPPENWDASKPNEITLNLDRINLDIAFLLSEEWETEMVSKDHWDKVGEDGYEEDPIGNGPWSYINLSINEYMLLERVPDHWRVTPKFHELQLLFVREAATRLAMLITGGAHIAAVPRDLHIQAEAAGMVVSKSTLPGQHTHLRLAYYQPNCYVIPETGKPPPGGCEGPTPGGYDPNDPLRNPTVRLALNYAIDREEINSAFFGGEGFPEVDYFPPWRNDWKDEWAPYPGPDGKTGGEGGWPYPYDPERAKELLVEAGYPDGFETEIWAFASSSSVPEGPDIALQIKQYWEAIGVRTKYVETDESIGNRARSREFPNWAFFSAPSLDPICVAPSFWWWEGGDGYREHTEISEFKHACDLITDPQERIELAQAFGDWWLENAVSVPLVWIFGTAVYNPGIVAEYKVNLLHIGPKRYHEWTEPVYQ